MCQDAKVPRCTWTRLGGVVPAKTIWKALSGHDWKNRAMAPDAVDCHVCACYACYVMVVNFRCTAHADENSRMLHLCQRSTKVPRTQAPSSVAWRLLSTYKMVSKLVSVFVEETSMEHFDANKTGAVPCLHRITHLKQVFNTFTRFAQPIHTVTLIFVLVQATWHTATVDCVMWIENYVRCSTCMMCHSVMGLCITYTCGPWNAYSTANARIA